MSGPPGIGKTTAAHVAAKVNGYELLEFNASDVRSKKVLEVCSKLGVRCQPAHIKLCEITL